MVYSILDHNNGNQ